MEEDRPKGKECAICGQKVSKGLIQCPNCGSGIFASPKKASTSYTDIEIQSNKQFEGLDIDELEDIIYEDNNPSRRRAALEKFIAGNEPVEVLVLTQIVCKSNDRTIRERALERLIERGDTARPRRLIMSWRDKMNAEERMWAAEALEKIL